MWKEYESNTLLQQLPSTHSFSDEHLSGSRFNRVFLVVKWWFWDFFVILSTRVWSKEPVELLVEFVATLWDWRMLSKMYCSTISSLVGSMDPCDGSCWTGSAWVKFVVSFFEGVSWISESNSARTSLSPGWSTHRPEYSWESLLGSLSVLTPWRVKYAAGAWTPAHSIRKSNANRYFSSSLVIPALVTYDVNFA